jgi:uncharacterized glyoxalase superfamily protein PhnB
MKINYKETKMNNSYSSLDSRTEALVPFFNVNDIDSFVQHLASIFDTKVLYTKVKENGIKIYQEILLAEHLIIVNNSNKLPQTSNQIMVKVENCLSLFQNALENGFTTFVAPIINDNECYAGIKDKENNIWWIRSKC